MVSFKRRKCKPQAQTQLAAQRKITGKAALAGKSFVNTFLSAGGSKSRKAEAGGQGNQAEQC